MSRWLLDSRLVARSTLGGIVGSAILTLVLVATESRGYLGLRKSAWFADPDTQLRWARHQEWGLCCIGVVDDFAAIAAVPPGVDAMNPHPDIPLKGFERNVLCPPHAVHVMQEAQNKGTYFVEYQQFGFPWPVLETQYSFSTVNQARPEARFGFRLSSKPVIVIPTKVLFIGGIANAAVFCMVLVVSMMLHRLRRVICGRCFHCGYAMVGLREPTCPECGRGSVRVTS